MKTVTAALFALLLTGCAGSSATLESTFPPGVVTEPAFPTLAACRDALGADADPDRGCLRLDFVKAVSPLIVLQGLEVLLDEKLVYARIEPADGRGDLDFHTQFTVSLSRAAAGKHTVRVGAVVFANGIVAPALRGMKLEVRSAREFVVPAGGTRSLTVVLSESLDKRVPLESRLSIAYRSADDGARTVK